jgi:Histidine kinase-, DNA gyrase B-, and HSP90-like ATPase
MATTAIPDGRMAQRRLIDKLEAESFGWDLMVGDAFVRGMRDIGYKSTSFALAELIDNAMQASATHVDIVFGFDGGATPTKIAVVDDGYGMEPKMIRASLVWGAGTRGEDRSGFGKYGYGLPSASVSQCHRVTVCSKTEEGEWHSAYLDIDEIADGAWTKGNRIEMPEQQPEDPPQFVLDYLAEEGRLESFTSGTIIMWEGLDRVEPKRREGLRASLVTDLGVIYRNFLVECPMTVDGVDVEPCDPLFLTEGFRYYDLDEDRAIELPPADVEWKDKKTGEIIGKMRVRFARMPATFFRKPEAKHTNRPGTSGTNERLEIADRNNGIIFCRNGRQIDVIRPPRKMRGASFNATTDRFWAVEVDFDATLDELFAITTSKQQVRPDDSVWDVLKDKANLFSVIGQMRTAYDKEAKVIAAELEAKKGEQRASVASIEEGAKFRPTKPPKQTPDRTAEAESNLEQEAQKRAKKAGLDPEVVKRELEAEREGKTHDVLVEDLPGAPFFKCVDVGGTRILYLNSAHPFYTELYSGPGSSPRLRAGLEIVLWALGEAEANADPGTDRRMFYERDRASIWSPYIEDALKVLKTIQVVDTEVEEEAA